MVGLRVAYEYETGKSPVPFSRISSMLDEELEEYRTTVLNRLPQFEGTHVLFEDLARVICQRMRDVTMPQGVKVTEVQVRDVRNGVRIRYRP